MSLRVEDIPLFISPPHLCTPSRIVGERRLASVLRELNNPESISDVLDVGCGGAEYRFMFPGCVYTGIDITDHQYAEKKERKHRFLIGSASHLPVKSNSHDLLYSSYAFEYFPDPKRALEEIYRVLRPGGVAVLCLPTKWVMPYDLLSDLLRRAGISIGQVSAQPGIKYYSPATFQSLARDANLRIEGISSVYGWPVLLLKTASSWCRVVLHLLSRLVCRSSIGRNCRIVSLYMCRKVTSSRNYLEWHEILRHELSSRSLGSHLILMLLRLASQLDRLTGFKPVAEYVAVLTKATNAEKL